MTGCLSRQTIQEFLSGQTTPHGGSAVETHLAECADCRKLADQVTGDAELAAFVSSHRRAPTSSSPPEASVAMRRKLYSLAERDEDHSSMTDGALAMTASGAAAELDGVRGLLADPGERPLGGRYRLRERVGSGGFGVVYLAEDLQLHRAVALKLPRAPLPHDSIERVRFFREANAAAGLHHPQIVALYDAGEMDGVCYLASAYCPGETLASWIAARQDPIDPDQSAQIVLALAEAIQHAHENGVLHRDIKPQNVLLDPTICYRNLAFSPKLTDFSIAKLMDGDGGQTATEMMLGTPRYMAPELAAGHRDQLGPACDVYALGVVLYELLTGRVPISGSSHADTLRRVLSDDPVPPRVVAPHVPRDLEAICLTCLEKDPSRRYVSAARLGEDIQRFLSHQPTIARPISMFERAVRWTKRRPAAAALAAVSVVASLVILVGLAAYSQQLATLNRDLFDSNSNLQRALTDTQRAKTLAESSDERARHLLYISDMRLAGRAWKAGDLRELTHFLRRHVPKDHEPDRRGFEWHFLWNQSEVQSQRLAQMEQAVYCIRVAPDNRHMAVAGKDAVVRIYDMASGTLVRSIETGQTEVNSVEFSPNGGTLASAGDDGTFRVWRVSDARNLLTVRAHDGIAYSALYSLDGTTIISCGNEGRIKFWNAATGESAGEIRAHKKRVEALAISQDGKWLGSAGDNSCALIWNVHSREEVAALRLLSTPSESTSLAFTRDGTRIVTGDNDHLVRLWEVATGRELAQGKHLDFIHSVAISPDGRYVASGDRTGTVQFWEVPEVSRSGPLPATGAVAPLVLLRSWRACNDRLYSITFSTKGDRLLTAGADGSVKSWSLPSVGGPRMLLPAGETNDYAFVPGSDTLAVSSDGWLRLYDLQTQKPILDVSTEDLGWCSIQCDDAAGFVAAAAVWGQWLGVWNATDGQQRQSWDLPLRNTPPILALAPDGSKLVVLQPDDNRLQLLDVASGEVIKAWNATISNNSIMRFSRDGRSLACTFDRSVYWFDESSDAVRTIATSHAQGLDDIAISPIEPLLATASTDRLVKLWDLRTGEELATFSGHRAPVLAVRFSPDGRSLITACSDGIVKVWNVAAGEELFDLYDHPGGFNSVQISSDARYLAFESATDDTLYTVDLGIVHASR